jgi:hypothetical protein
MSDQMQDPIPEYIKREMEREAEQGKRYPPEFVGNLAEKYDEAITEWLKVNKAPQIIIDAVDTLVMLERAHAGLRSGKLADWDARWLYQEHVNILSTLAALGGDFGGFSRDPVLWTVNTISELPSKS